MKKFMLHVFIGMVLLIVMSLSCFLFNNDPIITKLMNFTAEVAPAITPAGRSKAEPWYSANTNMSIIFWTFRHFDPALDMGSVDGSNIYFTLYDCDGYFERNSGAAEKFSSPKTIAPVYDFGVSSETYSHGGSSSSSSDGNDYINTLAYRVDGDWLYGNYGGSMDSTSQGKHVEAFLFKYNETSGELDVRNAYRFQDNTTGVRSKIIGNINDHSFFVHVQVGTNIANCSQIVAKGISQGSGNAYVAYVDATSNGDAAGYYLIPASSGESYFETNVNLAPEADYNNLSLDATTLSYAQDIENYLNTTGLHDTDLQWSDFDPQGMLSF